MEMIFSPRSIYPRYFGYRYVNGVTHYVRVDGASDSI
jgi:hypothetical protein